MAKITDNISEKISGGRCEVIGLGISNVPLCKYLKKNGAARVIGRDKKSEAELGDNAKELRALGIELILGDKYLEGLGGENTVIFRSPGLRPDIPEIKDAVERGAVLSSEMELFFERTKATVIAITGSDGKTTTTTLTGLLLSKQFEKDRSGRKVYIGGNIGEPLLPRVDEMTENDFAVVELSSFQLMTMKKSADRAVVTNITPNHLNWHTDMNEYTESKTNVYKGNPECQVTLNGKNGITSSLAKTVEASKITGFALNREDAESVSKSCVYVKDGSIIYSDESGDKEVIKVDDIKIPGLHNVENYMAAISVTYGLVSFDTVKEVAQSFGGVEHRCEFVRELDGVKYYNSSIDSSPTRTIAALSSFKDKVIVICGGYDKHIPFDPLAKALCKYAKALVLTGATADAIKSAINCCEDYRNGLFDIAECNDFTEAVKKAHTLARKGDTVILSPACASFDAFKNFEERGRRFKEIVNSL